MSRVRLKFTGSIALVLSTIGILLATGGQLNFLGNTRPESAATLPKSQTEINKPKYSFYDELKKRKIEVDNMKNKAGAQNTAAPSSDKKSDSSNFSYVVQVGAFSKKADANVIKNKLEKLGYGARIVKGGRKLLVQTTPIKGKEKAFAIEKKLKKQNFPTLVKRLK